MVRVWSWIQSIIQSVNHLQTKSDLPEFLSWSRQNLCCLLPQVSWSRSSTKVNCPRQKPEYSAAPPSELNTRERGGSTESSFSSFSCFSAKGLVWSGAGSRRDGLVAVLEQGDHLWWADHHIDLLSLEAKQVDHLWPSSATQWVIFPATKTARIQLNINEFFSIVFFFSVKLQLTKISKADQYF